MTTADAMKPMRILTDSKFLKNRMPKKMAASDAIILTGNGRIEYKPSSVPHKTLLTINDNVLVKSF